MGRKKTKVKSETFYPEKNNWGTSIIIPKDNQNVFIEFDRGGTQGEAGIVKVARFYKEYDENQKHLLALINYTPVNYTFSEFVRVNQQGEACINCYFIRCLIPSDEQFIKSGHNKENVLASLTSSDEEAVNLAVAVINNILKDYGDI